MATITIDKPGFTEKALAFAREMMGANNVEQLCHAIVGHEDSVLWDWARDRGLTIDEYHVALRSVLSATLMQEGVLHIAGGR